MFTPLYSLFDMRSILYFIRFSVVLVVLLKNKSKSSKEYTSWLVVSSLVFLSTDSEIQYSSGSQPDVRETDSRDDRHLLQKNIFKFVCLEKHNRKNILQS